jgi:hypothetical protein
MKKQKCLQRANRDGLSDGQLAVGLGVTLEDLYQLSDEAIRERLSAVVNAARAKLNRDDHQKLLQIAKRDGLSDRQLAGALGVTLEYLRQLSNETAAAKR